MKKLINLIIIFCVTTGIGVRAQVPEFDIVQAARENNKKVIVYLSAVWCSPCMKKIPAIVNNFKNYKDYKLVVIFDKYGLSNKSLNTIKRMVDSTNLYTLSSKYYSDKTGFISINPWKKVVKNIVADYNRSISPNIIEDDFWFGKALVINQDSVYITNSYNEVTLISEVKAKAK